MGEEDRRKGKTDEECPETVQKEGKKGIGRMEGKERGRTEGRAR